MDYKTKRIILSFANPKIRACDHLNDLTEAIESAFCNLKSRFKITLKGPIIIQDTLVAVDVTFPEGTKFNVGRRLRGISVYLLKNKPEIYKQYQIGTRLLTYIEI